MTVAAEQELDEVAGGIARWLSARRGVADLVLTRCDRPSDGLSSDTLMVDARGTGDGGEYAESLVVRRAPSGAGVFPEYDLAVQARVQDAVAAQGIPAASPVELETDPGWVGAEFMVMPAIAGHIPNQAPAFDQWINGSTAEGQRALAESFIDVLAAIHRVDLEQSGLAGEVPDRGVDAELNRWRHYLDWLAGGEVIVPRLADAFAWCVAHRPVSDPPATLVWGDVRLGNVIFDDSQQPVAVLDWEMTGIGPPEQDVAWYFALDAIQHELFSRPVPGFPDRDVLLARYESRLGRALVDLGWFEIFAMVRTSAIMTRLNVLEQMAGRPPLLPINDNPFIDILTRRITESDR